MADTGLITASPRAEAATESEIGAVSPEIMLVDPELASSARPVPDARDDADVFARPQARVVGDQDKQRASERAATLETAWRDPAIDARRRLLEAGIASEVLGEMVPSSRRLRRRATLIPAMSAAGSIALFVLQLYSSQGALG